MKVLLITQEDPIYVSEFWDEFVLRQDELKSHNIEIEALVSLETLGKSKKTDLFKRIYGMYGLIGTTKIAMKYLKARMNRKDIKFYAEKMGVRFISRPRIHSEEFLKIARNTDLIISAAASRKFKKKLLDAPKLGCINIHSGPLPKYQGMMPVFWQLKDGENIIGITIFKMNEELDAGDIYVQKFIDVSDCNTLDAAIRKTKKAGASMMIELLCNFEEFSNSQKLNNESEATYFSFPDRKAVKEFLKTGRKLI